MRLSGEQWLSLVITISTATCLLLAEVAIATTQTVIPPFHSHGGEVQPGQDVHGGIPMGVEDEECDNAKLHLETDWDGSSDDYTCPGDSWDTNKASTKASQIKPECTTDYDFPTHVCMRQAIVYDDVIPTSGAHRPLWAKYGEYLYLPKQRWLHNLEHGAAVFLYHPCANPKEISKFKRIAENCIRKHIITPFNNLTQETPFAVLTYGCKLLLPAVAPKRIKTFLREHVNKAPEWMVSQDGQFGHKLTKAAKIVSDENDCNICLMNPDAQCSGGKSASQRVRQALKNHHTKMNKKKHKKKSKV